MLAEPRESRNWRRLAVDNPAAVLSVVFVALFIGTDIVNRAQEATRS